MSGIFNIRGAAIGVLLLTTTLLTGQTTRPAVGLTNVALPGVISAGGDHIIKRWDSMGKLTATIGSHDDTVNGIAFLGKGGMTLVSVGAEGKLKIWNVPGARPTLVLDTKGDVSAFAVSPDGKLVATGGSDNHIRLWNTDGGKMLADVPAHADAIRALQFASDSALVSASADKTLRVWNVARNKPNALEYKSNIVAHDRAVTALALSPDGKTIASVSEDSFLKTWRIESGGLEHRARAGDGPVLAVAYSPDGRLLATGDESGKIRLFDATKGTPVAFTGSHDRAVTALAFAPDNKTLISGSEDKTLRYWNTMTGQMIAKTAAHEGAVRTIAVVP
jgi:WD40 repeat protein